MINYYYGYFGFSEINSRYCTKCYQRTRIETLFWYGIIQSFEIFIQIFIKIYYKNNISFFILGRKIAIDASMCLYQFLIAVRSEGAQLTSVDGETTRYIINEYIILYYSLMILSITVI